MVLKVALDGSGDFSTIQAAVDAAPEQGSETVIIQIGIGRYHEKLHITKDNLILMGEDAERVVLYNSDYAKQTYPDGAEKGTFLSYTVIITGNNVELRSMTIRNDAGPGTVVGQAVAVYAAGDRVIFRNVKMLANQDTLFCGPTMKKVCDNALPYILPNQSESVGDAGYTKCRQYFEDCLIQGDIDFIFGPYTCWFERCQLICNNRDEAVNGYCTAANTPEDQPYGFVFNRCHLKGDGCKDSTVYLGRPWRAYARTVFLNCEMDACVKPVGWEDWDKPVTFRYGEFNTTGSRADTKDRHPNATLLSPEEAQGYTVKSVLGGHDSWLA